MTDAERFWAIIDQSGGPDACWLWTRAPHSKQGYARFGLEDGQRIMAHRYAYQLLVGPIPKGLTLDHLCRNTLCVNPAHLEPCTLGENVLRSECPPAQNARKTHCKRGHAFDAANTIQRADGFRECRTCARLHQQIHDLRQKGCTVEWMPDGDALVAVPFDRVEAVLLHA